LASLARSTFVTDAVAHDSNGTSYRFPSLRLKLRKNYEKGMREHFMKENSVSTSLSAVKQWRWWANSQWTWKARTTRGNAVSRLFSKDLFGTWWIVWNKFQPNIQSIYRHVSWVLINDWLEFLPTFSEMFSLAKTFEEFGSPKLFTSTKRSVFQL